MKYLANSFSIQMLADLPAVPVIEEVSTEEIPEDIVSVIGHADTANVVGNILGRTIACDRRSIKIGADDVLYVAQLVGGRLPEGATTLPDGAEIKFLKVHILYKDHGLCTEGEERDKVCAGITNCYANCSIMC